MLVDLLHLARSLRRSPASAFAAVLTLSLTLAAGVSIFAVVDAIVLTPPPFANPEALVVLGETPVDQLTAAPRSIRYATFEAWRDRAQSLAAVEAIDGTNLTLTGLGAAERVTATNVTPGYLTLLGVVPSRGRTFAADDVGRPLAIISQSFWRRKLASDPEVVGRQIVLGGQAHTIVGVMPEQVALALDGRDVWRPFPVSPAQAVREGYRVVGVARVAHRVSPAVLAAALSEVSRTSSPPSRAVATPIAAAIAGDATRPLGLLAGAAALAMLIAFTNLAGLLLVRSIDRQRELAVRSALGARGFDIARQLVLEAAALVTAGILGGVLLALWVTPVVGRLVLEQFGGVTGRNIAISWRVIGIVSAAAAACAWICGSLPAFAAARRNVVEVLRRGATPPPREVAMRRVFVTAEVALAFVLLVSVTLLGRSLLHVLNTNPGFDAHGVLTLHVSVPAASYATDERVATFYSSLQNGLAERLGPSAVSVIDEIPLTGDRGRSVVSVRPADAGREAVVRGVSTGYFDVMRIPIVAGRSFDPRDNASAPPRAVLSASLAAALFANESPIGRRVSLAARRQTAEVVGVVGEVKHRALDELPALTVYLSAAQAPSRSSIIVVRSPRPDADVIATVREEVARLDREVPVYGMRPMEDVITASPGVPARRVLTATFFGFSLLAVVLGAIGLFGVVAHDVACRRRELGIRIALGADPRRILSATLGQGVLMVGIGLVAGGVLSIWASRALSGLLFGAGLLDVASVGVPALVLLLASLVAVLPSARRAARTDPLLALRSE